MSNKFLLGLGTTIAAIMTTATLFTGLGIKAEAAAKNPLSVAQTNAVIINSVEQLDADYSGYIMLWDAMLGSRPSQAAFYYGENTGADEALLSYNDAGQLQNLQYLLPGLPNQIDNTVLYSYNPAGLYESTLNYYMENGAPVVYEQGAFQYTLNKAGQVVSRLSTDSFINAYDPHVSKNSINYTYDKFGRVSRIKGVDTQGDKFALSISYKNGFVSRIYRTGGREGINWYSYNFNYRDDGQIDSIGGNAAVYYYPSYDNQNRLIQIDEQSHWVGSQYTRATFTY